MKATLARLGFALLIFALSIPASKLILAANDTAVYDGPRFPHQAFRQLPMTDLSIGGGTLHVAFAPGEWQMSRQALLAWVSQHAGAVAKFYGKLPDGNARLLILPGDGSGVASGSTWGQNGAASRITVGRFADPGRLARDWILPHELVHHALPALDDAHHWLEEGVATYVEPIARAQAGELRVNKVWLDLVEGLPQGLPQAGDRGLDRTPTWGRTYWGGALYCLRADVEIRRRTNNRFGLQDSLRGIVAAGANIGQWWPIEKVLAVGDRATHTHVMTELYDAMKYTAVDVNLTELWQQLGVIQRGNDVIFDDTAPLAHIRRAITAARLD